MPKPPAAPAEFVGEGKLIRPGLTSLGAKTKLYEAGFERLGCGTVAAALAIPGSDRVVKLVCGMQGHYTAVRLFEAHPEVEDFPRIYGVVELANECFAYETERLEDDGPGDNLQGYADGCADDYGEPWFEVVGRYFSAEAVSLLESVAYDANDTGYIDLHEENMMTRPGTSEYVIVDPFHCHDSYSHIEQAWITSGRTNPRAGWAPSSDYWENVRWRARKQPLRLAA